MNEKEDDLECLCCGRSAPRPVAAVAAMRDRNNGAWRVKLCWEAADGGGHIFCQSGKLRSRRGERLRHARAGLARGYRSFAGEIRELLG